MFETAPQRVSKLTVQVGSEPAYEIKREDDDTHTLADVPAGKKLKYVNSVEDIVTSASSLDFDDVRKAPADHSCLRQQKASASGRPRFGGPQPGIQERGAA